MELVRLESSVLHTAWNYCTERMAAGTSDGHIQIWDQDSTHASHSLSCTAKWKAHNGPVVKVVWGPPLYGDVIASCSTTGSLCLWEEVEEGQNVCGWRLCGELEQSSASILELQFGNCLSGLKLAAAFSDGVVHVYETLESFKLKQWQLQGQFQNATDLSAKFETHTCFTATISWRPPVNGIQQPVFVLGCNSSSHQFNVAKVWEFQESHQRWICLLELTMPDEDGNAVNCVSWGTNIGRPYEVIAVASGNGVSIWNVDFSSSSRGMLSSNRVARLNAFSGEVWQVEWDMSGMTLATSESNGVVKLWQLNYNGEWQQQKIIQGN